jgi:hypothetical protein
MLDLILEAVEAIDWDYVTLSRLRYGRDNKPAGLAHVRRWHERPFAYEIYHQARCIWEIRGLKKTCLIQAEVLKRYQEIKSLGKMPDLLFHVPERGPNFAVVEIKLASNRRKSLDSDLRKLRGFQRILGYRWLVEIVIGTPLQLARIEKRLPSLNVKFRGTTIHIIGLSLDTRRGSIRRIN